MCLYKMNKYDVAIKCLDDCLEINDKNEQAFLFKAKSLFMSGKKKKGKKVFGKYKELNKNAKDSELYFDEDEEVKE